MQTGMFYASPSSFCKFCNLTLLKKNRCCTMQIKHLYGFSCPPRPPGGTTVECLPNSAGRREDSGTRRVWIPSFFTSVPAMRSPGSGERARLWAEGWRPGGCRQTEGAIKGVCKMSLAISHGGGQVRRSLHLISDLLRRSQVRKSTLAATGQDMINLANILTPRNITAIFRI